VFVFAERVPTAAEACERVLETNLAAEESSGYVVVVGPTSGASDRTLGHASVSSSPRESVFRLPVYLERVELILQNKKIKFEESNMKTTMLPEESDAQSPAGADIRFLMDGKTGDMIHSTVPPHQINKATVHATVSEFWYVLEGHGEIWRDDGKESNITVLVPGTSIDIPVGTAFQYRNVSNVELKFICITMPPWPGESEATYVKGIWQPTI
jgi:mannose-6-phosphate isomerase-like protein (cupin superfamily)